MQQIPKRIVIITGTNKGIGYKVVEELCKSYSSNFSIIMTARDLKRGSSAYEQLKKSYPQSQLTFQTLDVSNEKSINDFTNWFKTNFKQYDVLVNNAAILMRGKTWDDLFHKTDDYQPTEQIARETLQTNFFGTIQLTEQMLSYLSKDGKIIQVSSQAGSLCQHSQEVQNSLQNKQMNKEFLFDQANKFIQECKSNKQNKLWFNSAYTASKTLLNAYVRYIGKKLVKGDQNMYTMHPGWIRTDMGTQDAPLSIEEGSKFLVHLIAETPFKKNKWNGKFLCENQEIEF